MLDGEDPESFRGVVSYNRTVKTIESDEALFIIVHVIKSVKGASLAHSGHGESETLLEMKLSKMKFFEV